MLLLVQGLCKFGFYEVFKHFYSGIIGEENTYLWRLVNVSYILLFTTKKIKPIFRTSLYLAASASAEFFADIALCPMESAKVHFKGGGISYPT